MWQPGWKGSLGENGYMYMYGWVPSPFTWNYQLFVVAQSLSHVWLCDPLDSSTPGFLGSSLSPGVCSHSCPLSWWCRPTISSVVPFSSCFQSSPASGSFPMSQFFTTGGQSIGASAFALVLLMNIQVCFPLGLTDLISQQSKGLSAVFSRTIVQNHQFFSDQPSLWSNSHICTWLLEKP